MDEKKSRWIDRMKAYLDARLEKDLGVDNMEVKLRLVNRSSSEELRQQRYAEVKARFLKKRNAQPLATTNAIAERIAEELNMSRGGVWRILKQESCVI